MPADAGPGDTTEHPSVRDATVAAPARALAAFRHVAAGLGGPGAPLGRGPATSVVVVDDGWHGGPGDAVATLAAPLSAVPCLHAGPGALPASVGEGTVVVVLGGPGATAAAAAGTGATVVDLHGAGGGTGPAGTPGPAPERSGPWATPGWADLVGAGLAVVAALDPSGAVGAQVAEGLAAASAAVAAHGAPGGAAARLARSVGRTWPLFVGTDPVTDLAARACAAAFQGTARAPAFWSAAADASGPGSGAWGQHGDVTRQVLTAVVLARAEGDGPGRAAARCEDLLEFTAGQHAVEAAPGGDVAVAVELVALGQLVALERAAAEGLVTVAATSLAV